MRLIPNYPSCYMDIKLSFRQALLAAHSLNKLDCITFQPKIHVDFFVSGDVHVYSGYVSESYANKWYPLIMGENAYRNYFLLDL